MTDRWGFPAKITVRNHRRKNKVYSYPKLNVGEKTVELAQLQKADLVEVNIIKPGKGEISFRKKLTGGSGNQLQLDIPKEKVEEISLEKNDLVQVFLRKQ